MIDALARNKITPFLDRLAPRVAQSGLTANRLTLLALGFGLAACFFAAMAIYPLAFVFFAVSRFIDGMDGAVARAAGETNLGSFMDFFCDFAVFAAFPFFFILGAPEHSMSAVILLFSYVMMMNAYLLHHLFALRTGATEGAVGGIVENTEMIVFVLLCCLLPIGFSAFAIFFALMCLATAALRTLKIIQLLKA